MKSRPGRLPTPPLRLFALLTLVACAVLPSSVSAARFLHFQAQGRPQGIELVACGRLVLRVRPGMSVNGGMNALAGHLNELAFTGLKPTDVTVKVEKDQARILVRGTPLITVTKATAQLARATPAGLASDWAGKLKGALAEPYIVLEPRGRLPVPLGETRVLRWGGTAAIEMSFSSADPAIATVQLDEAASALTVRGLGLGTTTLTAAMSGDRLQLPLEVKAWAVRIASSAVAEVTCPPLPADDLRRTIRNAVLRIAQPAPGATVQLGEPTAKAGRYVMPVRASGQDCFDVDRDVPVDVKVVSLARPAVQQLLVSNMPEKVTEPATLLRERFLGRAPVRLLWHHVNKSPRPLRFTVRVANLGATPARLHVTEAATGPHDDEIFVGHQAMMRFLALNQQGEGYVLGLPAGRMLDLCDVRLPVEGIVSGLAHLTPLEGENLLLEVVAEDVWPTDAFFAAAPPRLLNDPPLTPYRFEATKEVAVSYEAGGPWGFYSIGKEFSTNLQGQKLYGDYGVQYAITITCRNKLAEAARCLVTLRAGGGVARASYFVGGNLQETGLLRSGTEETIQRFDLAPGEERVLKLITMPESGSNYPITLCVRGPQARE